MPIAYQNDLLAVGGQLYGAKLTSIWGPHTTSTFTFDYNNKGGNKLQDYEGILGSGPALRRRPLLSATAPPPGVTTSIA